MTVKMSFQFIQEEKKPGNEWKKKLEIVGT